MALYFFQAKYRGDTLADDTGEEFSTADEAKLHAAVVANEITRNNSEPVTIVVLDESGALIASVDAANGQVLRAPWSLQ
jgi:Domain of unknown function (DUF6894)